MRWEFRRARPDTTVLEREGYTSWPKPKGVGAYTTCAVRSGPSAHATLSVHPTCGHHLPYAQRTPHTRMAYITRPMVCVYGLGLRA